ncbi:MAG: hypothetical protein MZU97_24845 [Bacillus subtilis]|nr:hypothetical protein [Bacillus subtilis]
MTKDGAIVYVTDYTFDSNGGPFYQTDFSKLAKLREYGVLALMSESSGVLTTGHATSNQNLIRLIRETIQKTTRRLDRRDVFHRIAPHPTSHQRSDQGRQIDFDHRPQSPTHGRHRRIDGIHQNTPRPIDQSQVFG